MYGYFLEMHTSSYGRKENGKIKISNNEWRKIAKFLEKPLEEIYESDENLLVVLNDNSSDTGNVACPNVANYNIAHSLLENQNKYIEKLEEEINKLKAELHLSKCDSSLL